MAAQAITSRDLSVQSVESKPAQRNPSAPFMTSTLQQEASRKFGMGARQTMSAAQRLYEAGHITYMRTEDRHGGEAVMATRDAIAANTAQITCFVPAYVQKQAKNAQEAHGVSAPQK